MGPLHPDLGEAPRMTTVACFYATMTLANCTLISRRPSANLLSEASHDASVQLPLEFTPMTARTMQGWPLTLATS